MIPRVFGYGSLVNVSTHALADPQPARLRGWRREWRHTEARPVAYLSVRPDARTTIDGLVAGIPGGDWRALDAREAAYRRHDVSAAVTHDLEAEPQIAVYAVPRATMPGRHPILLSYLDAVVQGYARIHGTAGVTGFFDTTDGWDAPVLDDRHAPRYPRHQPLSPAERALTDAHLARLPAVVQKLE